MVSNVDTFRPVPVGKLGHSGDHSTSSPCQVPFAEDQNSPAGVELNLAMPEVHMMGNHGASMQRCLSNLKMEGSTFYTTRTYMCKCIVQ